jgi:plastocyanin
MHANRLAVASVTALLALGGCGDDDEDSSGSTGEGASTEAPSSGGYGSGGGGSEASKSAGGKLKLTADPDGGLSFDKTTLETKSGEVSIVMDNPDSAGIPHAVGVEGNGVDEEGETAEPGGTSEVSATLKPGTYTFYCPVPGHEEGGMKGTLTVR